MPELKSVTATRYVAPLREGGSLPGLVEADDDGLYVMKFRGAGQGARALVAEVVAGELARELGMPVPELVIAHLDPSLTAAEPDAEIQELAAASAGENLGVDYLPGALPFTPLAASGLSPEQAAELVWLDALVTNVDRTPRNPNLLVWHGRTWMIDHGAAFFRQHGSTPLSETARAQFPYIAEHVALPAAGSIVTADAWMAPRALAAVDVVLGRVPVAWLGDDPDRLRKDFRRFLRERLQAPRGFVQEAELARP